MSLVTEEVRAKAQVCRGNKLCQEKRRLLLKELGVPNEVLPLKDIEEYGFVKETGFLWLRQKQSITHKFEKIGKLASYGTEVTAVVENGKLKKLTGVKAKELFLWMNVNEMEVDYLTKGNITLKTSTGLTRTFPITAFEDTEEEECGGASAANGVVGIKEV